MTLDELLEKLKELRYNTTVLGEPTDFPIIERRHFDQVEKLIRQYALDNHDSELGELKAKCYAYEKIIANSNFAPMTDKGVDNDTSREKS